MTWIGVALIVAAALLFWGLLPRGGKEARILQVPGMWALVPITIMLGILAGGALIYTFAGR